MGQLPRSAAIVNRGRPSHRVLDDAKVLIGQAEASQLEVDPPPALPPLRRAQRSGVALAVLADDEVRQRQEHASDDGAPGDDNPGGRGA
mgnify:CR=1 FL=1